MVLTGATGLIGHQLLARLLARGARCAVVVRNPEIDATRLDALLEPLGESAAQAIAREQLVLLRGDLRGEFENPAELQISAIVHLAGCTRFHLDSHGDPSRTNVAGTQRLLEWASRHDINAIHFASTAYAAGRSREVVPEAPLPFADDFNNDYERSKWTCERLCEEWSRQGSSRRLTVLRPSIVVGEWASGRTTSFNGLYFAVRAVQSAVETASRQGRSRHRRIELRLPGNADGVQNIVPVDYVANMMAAIVLSESHHVGCFNLVHPAPPSNELIRTAIQEALDIDGLTFGGADSLPSDRSRLERIFDRVVEPICPYIAHSQRFARERVARVERAAQVRCPVYDVSALVRLCAFAVQQTCTTPFPSPGLADQAAEYFEVFLPRHVPQSSMARLVALTANVRFMLKDIPDGAWLCRFDAGRLASVMRTTNGIKEDFGYSVSASTFLRIIAAQLDPQSAFLSGQIEVSGDIEQALKMAMVLHQFNSEFPFRSAATTHALEGAIRA